MWLEIWFYKFILLIEKLMKTNFLLFILLVFVTTVAIVTDTRANTNTVSSTVLNNAPATANAPTVLNSNSDICKIGIGGSVQNNILGVATGYVITDEFCERVRTSRALYSYGMKVAAVSLLCQDHRVWTSMKNAGTPCPVNGLIGAEAASYWEEFPEKIPEGSPYRDDYLQVKKEETKEFSDASSIALYKALFLITTGLLLF